jgi:hypothetical protein
MTTINNDYTAFIKYLDTLKNKNNNTTGQKKVTRDTPLTGVEISNQKKGGVEISNQKKGGGEISNQKRGIPKAPLAGVEISNQKKAVVGIDTCEQKKVVVGIDTYEQKKAVVGIDTYEQKKAVVGIDTYEQKKAVTEIPNHTEVDTPINNTISHNHTDIDSIEKRKMLEKTFNEHFMIDGITNKSVNTDKTVNTDKKRQILEDLFNKKMAGELSETSINHKKSKNTKKDVKKDGKNDGNIDINNKLLIDALKYESKRFDKLCINNAIVGYSNINNMCILEIDKLLYNVKMYISHNKKYKNFVIYKNKGIYYLLTKKELTKLDDKYTKFLKICLKQFNEKDKFRKVINNTTYRCCHQVYTLHKTKLEEIELIICTKINNDDL